MRGRPWLALLLSLTLVAACAGKPNDHERAVCDAVRRLESVRDRDEQQALLETMIVRSRKAENREMIGGSVAFKKAVAAKHLGDATEALTKLTDECEQLGLRQPPS